MFATRRYAFLLVLLCMLLFYGALVVPLSFASTAPLPVVATDRFVSQDHNDATLPASAPVMGLPISVTMAGSFQSELGCPGDWQPECVSTQLTYDADDDVWQGTWTIPAGDWEYKAALNGSWDENYGLNATPGGANIPLALADPTSVKFYYDDKTHWVTDNQYSVIATAAGSFQSEMGCPGDWSPDCLRSWLEDPDGDGVYSFVTTAIPAGNYEVKAALNESWDVNYGAGCAPGGANIPFSVAEDGTEIYFEYHADTHCLAVSVEGAPTGNISLLAAHWVLADTIAWNVSCEEGDVFWLHYSATAELELTPSGVTGGETLPLTCDPAGLPASVQEKFPHLAAYSALKLDADDVPLVPAILKGQFAVSQLNSEGDLLDARGIQIPGVLDDLYTYEGELGIVWDEGAPTLRLWAPTAQSISVHLFADSTTPVSTTHEMTWDAASGTWSVMGEASWIGQYYLYEVVVYAPTTMNIEANLVTDPYAVSLSMNSQRSQIVDLDDPALEPEAWTSYQKPPLDDPEDITVYELHMRDFSVNDPSVPADLKGKYLAFTLSDSYGMQHLHALAQAGLSHLHLLPTFDIATINENPAERDEADWDVLASYPPDSEEQQALVGEYREIDAFNWGYDPFHYNVPEGSYSTDPDSTARILEYREMVKAINDTGLRVVMDVVYNHTNASGQAERSVLDRVVPGYYHRLNPETGSVEMSTCCQNTATEHNMMEKLMIDSVVLWATAYKIDAFRFDLMGHHMKDNMIHLQDALHALTLEEDGVDGSKIYVYGEGWNFGEVADNARGVNATQLNMAGTGIGTYNDRLRDAVRGGGPFDSGDDLIRNQGFSNGLYYDPNALNSGSDTERERLLLLSDQIRVGLTGNLADFTFTDRNGNTVSGADVDYNGQPAGYTQDPQENIVYDSKHDNQTLYDNNAYKAPTDISLEDRVRVQNMGSDLVGLSQGVPFFQAGVDMLRSKSLDRNSYDSGDWFNKLDFTYMDNNWGVGLPPAQDNESNWSIMRPLLADPNLDPSPTHILQAVNHFQELLAIRASSSLFHLETEAEVMERLHFLNTGPDQQAGLIVMSLSDEVEPDLDEGYEYIVVLFNANDEAQSFTDASLAGRPLVLHPVQVESTDPVVRDSTFDTATGAFNIPARTTAVFVQPSDKLAVTLSEMGTDSAAGGVGLPLALLGITLAVGLLIARRRRAA